MLNQKGGGECGRKSTNSALDTPLITELRQSYPDDYKNYLQMDKTEDKDEITKETFFLKLEHVFDTIPTKDIKTVIGD
ncbi:hypothetical protein J437_LFUL010560 [Ladona fulva]|uniref:Uncharacterized protein n=1 Tax=Ladona fulva TaxID=123851 RepID=A0A8K0P7A7_LADFU|nr:hypothetical protein J437_LFUL010560 [Ladona fulva]